MKHVYPLNTTGGWRWLIAILAVFICTMTGNAQVSGVVFRDFDSNGIRSDTLPIELGVSGVAVRAFINFSQTPVSTVSDANGNYSFSSTAVPAGSTVRIEFGDFLTGYFNSSYGSNNGTSVQFAKSPAEHIDLGINYPADYCQREGKRLITSCFVNGDSQSTLDINGNPVPLEKQAAQTDALVMFPYEASGIAGPGNFLPVHAGTAGEIGTVWGLAYQRRAKKVFSTAFVKRHTSFGPAGPGGIYVTDIASGVSTAFMSVTALGISAGEDPHKDPLANLFGDKTAGSTDPSAMSAVGRMSFGGADMSEDDKIMYFVNLHDRNVYGLTLGLPAVVPALASDVKSWAIPNPGCSNGDFRPWALKVHRGKIYVGVVCSAETSQQASDLRVTIYRFDPEAANAVFEEVLSFPLDYQRGPLDITGTCITKDHWLPWTDAWPEPCGKGPTPNFAMSAQPMVTDLDFDVDGSMFIGMLSRFAHLGGHANHDPTGNGGYDSFGFGDILRAYNNKGTFELENNGQAGPLTGTGVGDNDGPGGGEFYGLDNWTFLGNVANREITSGALSFAPGYNEIINSTIDPIEDRYLSGGLKVFDATKATITRQYELYRLAEGLFAKAGGLGDNKLLCDAAPIEIGNRFWFDDNRDGIQNAYEPGIDGVVLTLYDMANGDTPIASQTTYDGGQFYFNNTTVPAGLQYNHRYEIRMDMTQLSALDITIRGAAPAAGSPRQYNLSPANSSDFTNPDLRDSDAQLTGSTAIITVTTLDAGQNDFTNDLGIYACPKLRNEKDNLSLCSGMPLDSVVFTGINLSQVDSVRFVVFSSPQSGTAMYGSGGTLLGTVLPNPTTGRAVLRNPVLNTANTTAGVTSQYIYALVWPMPADPNCRQSSQTVLNVSPAVSASAAGGEINCSTTQIALTGQAIYSNGALVPNATYTWAGPGGFSSNQQNPVVSVAGAYTLTVGNPTCSGLLTTAFATVTTNTAVPVASINNLTLTCATPSGVLTVNTTDGVTPYLYRWNRGETTAGITVSAAGPYSVTVTGANGCFVIASITVTSDTAVPAASVNNMELTCTNPSGMLSASVTGGKAPYTYLWNTGQNTASISVSTAGPYSVTVTGSDGCGTATASTTVTTNTVTPVMTTTVVARSCAGCPATVAANSPGAILSWTGPNNFAAVGPGAQVTADGTYIVTATTNNGCTASARLAVVPFLCPELSTEQTSLSLCSGMILDSLTATTLRLTAGDQIRFIMFTSPQSGTAMYENTGQVLGSVRPRQTSGRVVLFNSVLNTVNNTGAPLQTYIYAIIVPTPADPACRQSSQTVLTISPAVSASASGGEITCSVKQVTLTGQAYYGDGNPAISALYSWSGPNGFSSNQQNPVVSVAGNYTLAVSNPACSTMSSQTTVTVTTNTVTPAMTTTVVARSCAGCPATVAANSPGAILSWTGPNNFAAVGPGAQVTADGTYIVTATTNNGCTASARLAVVPFICPPTTCIPVVVRRGKK